MPYRWNSTVGQFYNSENGRYVPRADVDRYIERVIDDHALQVRGLTEQLARGEISVEAWENQMRAAIKSAHVTIGLLGAGGRAGVSAGFYQRLGGILKGQFAHLSRWAAQLRGTVLANTPGNIAKLLFRAQMYAEGARRELWEEQTALAKNQAKGQKRRILGQAEHCVDCVHEASLGWVALDDNRVTIPGSGVTACLTNCKCVLEFR